MKKIVDYILLVIAILLLIYIVFFSEQLSETKFLSLLVYSLIMFLFLIFKNNISKFSVFGLEADLSKKINEVDESIKYTKELAKVLAVPILSE